MSDLKETQDWCAELRAENARLRKLVQCLLDNDPDADAADGVTVLDVWREDAKRALKQEEQE